MVKGRQAIPNPGVSLYEFTGAMFENQNTPPPHGPAPGGGPQANDPVDLATGLFVMDKTDLHLSGVLPLALQRTYRPNDLLSRPFGIGATHNYAIRLWSANAYQEVDLITPDGARVHYTRTSPGNWYFDAVFEHTSSPTIFYKSRIIWNEGGWELKLRDGTLYKFGDARPLQWVRDRFGNVTTLTYSSGFPGQGYGRITRIDSAYRSITLSYDGSDRIIEARDNIGRTVRYEYDGSGRLWRVTDVAGGVTE